MSVLNIKKLYEQCIGNKVKPILFRYDVIINHFEYHPYRHYFNSEFENEFIELLFDNIIFYAFENKEIEQEYDKGRFDDLCKLSRYAYNSRMPHINNKNSGLLGELTLDILLRIYYPNTDTMLASVKYTEPNKHSEIKGYDAIRFISNHKNDIIELWLGQVKTGTLQYCLSSIIKDINKNILKEYFCGQMMFIADRGRDKECEKFGRIISDINNLAYDFVDNNKEIVQNKIIEYFKINKIKIVMPSIVIYTNDQYDSCDDILQSIKKQCVEKLDRININNKDKLDIQVLFLVFPVRNIELLRTKLFDMINK